MPKLWDLKGLLKSERFSLKHYILPYFERNKQLLYQQISSMIVEVIRTNFGLLFFFTRTFYKHKKHKNAHKQTKKATFFMLIKTSKRNKVTCFTFCMQQIKKITQLLFWRTLGMFGYAWSNQINITWFNYSFHGYLTTCKNEHYTSNRVLKYYSLKHYAIWLLESILAHNLRTRHVVFTKSYSKLWGII